MPFFLDMEMPNTRNFVNYHAIIQIGLVSSGKRLRFISNVNPGVFVKLKVSHIAIEKSVHFSGQDKCYSMYFGRLHVKRLGV